MAIPGISPALHAAIQRVRSGPGLLRRVVHDEGGQNGVVPGTLCDEVDGGVLRQENEPCRD